MKFNLLFKRNREKVLAEKQREATKVHKQNINTIVKSRKSADKVIEELNQNQIIIQIAGAIGHH